MKIVLSLGSNVGDRMGHLRRGVGVLRTALEVTAVSPVYETAPIGGPEQGPYLNALVLAEADDPRAALGAAQAAEADAGRTREVRWGPRTLDVDVIDAGATTSDDPVLTLPHPRAHERTFVLVPWLDVEPDAALPGHGSVAALVAGLGRDGVVRTDEVLE
jgi:2-amino-4-hydroxy-6-hydroxymethyldihydropteridine diphosphokinase